MSGLQVRSKVWLEVDGEPVLGEGREELLRRINRTGSISAAARSMGLGYRKAWSRLQSMEKHLGFAVLKRSRGGSRGGTTVLTPEALDLLGRFEVLQRGVREQVNHKFARQFAGTASILDEAGSTPATPSGEEDPAC